VPQEELLPEGERLKAWTQEGPQSGERPQEEGWPESSRAKGFQAAAPAQPQCSQNWCLTMSRPQRLLLETVALATVSPVAAMRSAKWFETAAAAQSQDLQFWSLEQEWLQAAPQPVNQWPEELLEKSL
jgi:hypothetical protein